MWSSILKDDADRRTGAQTSIIQNLSYFEHLAEPMAEFLHILAEQYDYPQLSDEILRFVFLSGCSKHYC